MTTKMGTLHVDTHKISATRSIDAMLKVPTEKKDPTLTEVVFRERNVVDGRESFSEVSLPLASLSPLLTKLFVLSDSAKNVVGKPRASVSPTPSGKSKR